MIEFLYKITNNVTNKVYIGKTKDPKRRWREHQNKDTGCIKLVNSFNKHGKENFTFTVLCIGSPNYIGELEILAIKSYDSISNGYNIHLGSRIISGFTANELLNDPVFVSGFWFPCADHAMYKMGMSARTYKSRRDRGVLGLETDKPIKVAVKLTEEDFNVHLPWGSEKFTEKKRQLMLGKNKGDKNAMFGNFNNHRSRAIKIFGVEYPSISEAVRLTEYTKSQIEKRLKKGHPDFKYAQESTG